MYLVINFQLNFGKTSCGLLLPTWFPASLDENKLVKRWALIYQMMACWTVVPFTMIVSLVLQANEFIAYRIDHLKSLLRKVGYNEDEDADFHLQQFLAYVQYHHHIIGQVGPSTIDHRCINSMFQIMQKVESCV